MNQPNYDETVEVRPFVQGSSQFYTADEQAVFHALRAEAVRKKSQLGLRTTQYQYWEQELAAVADALPLEHPLIAAALVDGESAFRARVADRIWAEHHSEFEIPRCPKCECILKTSRARQCLWCGHDWH